MGPVQVWGDRKWKTPCFRRSRQSRHLRRSVPGYLRRLLHRRRLRYRRPRCRRCGSRHSAPRPRRQLRRGQPWTSWTNRPLAKSRRSRKLRPSPWNRRSRKRHPCRLRRRMSFHCHHIRASEECREQAQGARIEPKAVAKACGNSNRQRGNVDANKDGQFLEWRPHRLQILRPFLARATAFACSGSTAACNAARWTVVEVRGISGRHVRVRPAQRLNRESSLMRLSLT